MAQLYTVHWSSIDGPQYYVEFDDVFDHFCECGDHDCTCPEPKASQMTLETAQRVVDELNDSREKATSGEAFDNAPHQVRMIPVAEEGK